jgi:hypothetical protein
MYSQTQLNDFITVYFLNCFFQRHVSALVMSHLQVDGLESGLMKISFSKLKIDENKVLHTFRRSFFPSL